MNQHESTILVDFPLLSIIFSMSWSRAWNPWRNNESIESLIQGGRAEIESKEVGFENSGPFSFSEGRWNFNQLSQKIPGISFRKISKKFPFQRLEDVQGLLSDFKRIEDDLGRRLEALSHPAFSGDSWVPSDGYRGLVYVEVHGSLIWTWWRLVSFHLSLEVPALVMGFLSFFWIQGDNVDVYKLPSIRFTFSLFHHCRQVLNIKDGQYPLQVWIFSRETSVFFWKFGDFSVISVIWFSEVPHLLMHERDFVLVPMAESENLTIPNTEQRMKTWEFFRCTVFNVGDFRIFPFFCFKPSPRIAPSWCHPSLPGCPNLIDSWCGIWTKTTWETCPSFRMISDFPSLS